MVCVSTGLVSTGVVSETSGVVLHTLLLSGVGETITLEVSTSELQVVRVVYWLEEIVVVSAVVV